MTTDRSGTVVTHQSYYAYGKYRTGGALPTDHKFTAPRGPPKLDATGLYYYNARYYDPQLGTFISPDTLVPDPGNVMAYNRYMYVFGNPMKYNDKSGHCPWCIGAGVGAAVGGGWYLANEAWYGTVDLTVDVSWSADSWVPSVNMGDDWADLGAATVSGMAAGALLPVAGMAGVAAGAGEVATAMGTGMAGNLVADHFGNSLTGEDFSSTKHFMAATTGMASGIVAPGLGQAIAKSPALAASSGLVQKAAETVGKGVAVGTLNATGNYLTQAIIGQPSGCSVGCELAWGVVGSTVGNLGDLAPNNAYWEMFLSVNSEVDKAALLALSNAIHQNNQK